MSIFKPKKSKKGAIIAATVGAVAAGAAALYSTKKGKAMLKDAGDGLESLIGSTKKLQKTVKSAAKNPIKKTVTATKRTSRLTGRAKKA